LAGADELVQRGVVRRLRRAVAWGLVRRGLRRLRGLDCAGGSGGCGAVVGGEGRDWLAARVGGDAEALGARGQRVVANNRAEQWLADPGDPLDGLRGRQRAHYCGGRAQHPGARAVGDRISAWLLWEQISQTDAALTAGGGIEHRDLPGEAQDRGP